jgi:hypothetical protein
MLVYPIVDSGPVNPMGSRTRNNQDYPSFQPIVQEDLDCDSRLRLWPGMRFAVRNRGVGD